MKNSFLKISTVLLALAASTVSANAASPMIEDAKSKCVVGEQSDGYLGVVDNLAASEEVKREVRAVNQQRKAAFAELAARNGVTIEDAAALTGKRLVEAAASGQCVRLPDGSWSKQP
jgi:uncharacterized protein YdbL (DUF1318 family)